MRTDSRSHRLYYADTPSEETTAADPHRSVSALNARLFHPSWGQGRVRLFLPSSTLGSLPIATKQILEDNIDRYLARR